MQVEKQLVEYITLDRMTSFAESLVLHGLLQSEELAMIDDEFIEKLQNFEWKADPVRSIPGVCSAIAYFGEHLVGPEEIKQNALRRFNGQYTQENAPWVPDDVGFPELYQIPKGLTEAQHMLFQQYAAQELIQNACEALGVASEDIDLFIITCSIPVQEDWARRIAKMLGIPFKKMIIYHKACNSTGGALFDIHNHLYDKELIERVPGFAQGSRAVAAIFAIETANGFDGKADLMSPYLFASAAGATIFDYSLLPDQGPFTLVAGAQHDIEKGAEHLKYRKPYTQENWPNYRTDNRVVESLYLQAPPDGWLVEMNGPDSGAYFKVNGIEITKEVLTQFAEVMAGIGPEFDFRLENGEFDLTAYTQFIKKGILHHPSHVVFDSVGKRLTKPNFKIGFRPEQIPFVVPEGNAPSVIIHVALGRQLEDSEFGDGLNDGDMFMVLSFGAGGSFTCAIYKYTNIEKLDTTAQ